MSPKPQVMSLRSRLNNDKNVDQGPREADYPLSKAELVSMGESQLTSNRIPERLCSKRLSQHPFETKGRRRKVLQQDRRTESLPGSRSPVRQGVCFTELNATMAHERTSPNPWEDSGAHLSSGQLIRYSSAWAPQPTTQKPIHSRCLYASSIYTRHLSIHKPT